jgi:hypothetical protein
MLGLEFSARVQRQRLPPYLAIILVPGRRRDLSAAHIRRRLSEGRCSESLLQCLTGGRCPTGYSACPRAAAPSRFYRDSPSAARA